MQRLLRVLKRAAVGWLLWRIFGPELPPRYAPKQIHPLRIPGRTVFVGERELFVRESGPDAGPPLVLIHGWSFDGEMTFHRIIPALAKHYRVIIPDNRNHGRSDWIRGQFDIETMADELAGVLDAIDISGATVFGWSMGGLVTQALARRRPDLVGRMVLGGTAARPIIRMRYLTRLMFLFARAGIRVSRNGVATAWSQVLLRTGSVDVRHHRWMRAALLRRDPTLWYESGLAVWKFDSRSWVGKLAIPTLLFIPTNDQIIVPAAQYELASLLPAADVIELIGARHEAVMNRGDEIVEAIISLDQ